MAKKELYLTPEGAAKLRRELEELSGPKRVELAKRLRHAIQQGDLTENADYAAAKEDQAFLEGRIQELEAILREAEIVDGPANNEEVAIGSTVLVVEDGRDPEEYRLVGLKEADPRGGKISHESPIGQALVGKRVGEIAVAKTPAGERKLKILKIS